MKKTTKLMCGLMGLGLLVTGCATVGNIKNNYEDIIFNGNVAANVDGYLYYANALEESTFETNSDYDKSVKTSYLARLNTNIDLAAETRDYSPEKVETVTKEVVGQTNSFMFVLGKHIYYATPNKQEFENDEGKPEKHFEYTTFYRSQLNGNSKEKIYTTKGEVSEIEVLKSGNNYYIVMLAGDQLVKINIGSASKTKVNVVVVEGVNSIAMPETYQKDKAGSTLDWNGYVYYTTTKTDEHNSDVSGTVVNRIKADASEGEVMESYAETLTFVGREKDVVFYTLPVTSDNTYTYAADLSEDNGKYALRNNKTEFATKELSSANISLLTEQISDGYADCGYVYVDGSAVKFAKKTANGYETKSITFNADGVLSSYNVLGVSGRTIYLSTTTGVYRADLSNVINATANIVTVNCDTIVTMADIYNGTLCAIDKNYIYFYAKLEEVETEEGEEEAETDDNYYFYRARLSRSSGLAAEDNYELLSKAR